VGYAPAGKFGARATLGTDGIGSDMFAEAKLAYFRSRDAGQPIDVLRYLTNGHRLVSQLFDAQIGPMREGAVADLLVLDYRSPTRPPPPRGRRQPPRPPRPAPPRRRRPPPHSPPPLRPPRPRQPPPRPRRPRPVRLRPPLPQARPLPPPPLQRRSRLHPRRW